MKVIMIYDQIQSGEGTKDDKMVPLGAKKEPVGPAVMMAPFLKKIDAKVVACLYCGNGYYNDNKEEVIRKLTAMIAKLNPDVVMCGPTFNYADYASMAAHVAKSINEKTSVPALAAMSAENESVIEAFKDQILIVKTPKKGPSLGVLTIFFRSNINPG
ncbi:MAG: GrdB-related putative oxidoreductase, partial [Bacillota bacterium]|nr:GrdB-related putative oxidoreductase [Bacillota bacterium]